MAIQWSMGSVLLGLAWKPCLLSPPSWWKLQMRGRLHFRHLKISPENILLVLLRSGQNNIFLYFLSDTPSGGTRETAHRRQHYRQKNEKNEYIIHLLGYPWKNRQWLNTSLTFCPKRELATHGDWQELQAFYQISHPPLVDILLLPPTRLDPLLSVVTSFVDYHAPHHEFQRVIFRT